MIDLLSVEDKSLIYNILFYYISILIWDEFNVIIDVFIRLRRFVFGFLLFVFVCVFGIVLELVLMFLLLYYFKYFFL